MHELPHTQCAAESSQKISESAVMPHVQLYSGLHNQQFREICICQQATAKSNNVVTSQQLETAQEVKLVCGISALKRDNNQR